MLTKSEGLPDLNVFIVLTLAFLEASAAAEANGLLYGPSSLKPPASFLIPATSQLNPSEPNVPILPPVCNHMERCLYDSTGAEPSGKSTKHLRPAKYS